MFKISHYNPPVFKEYDFITTLLFLMYQNGVTQIEEEKLAQKLYYYHLSREYNELFQDINYSQTVHDHRINITRGLYQEKLSGNLFTEPLDHQKQNLVYDDTRDISQYEKKLSEDGKQKIRKLAKELAIMDETERENPYRLYIYKKSPNHIYTLVHGMISNEPFHFNLKSDGQITILKSRPLQYDPTFYIDPIDFQKHTRIDNPHHQLLNVSNAQYTIKQAIYNNHLCYSVIETKIVDKDSLKQIVKEADQVPEKQYKKIAKKR